MNPPSDRPEYDAVMKPLADFWASYVQQASEATKQMLTGVHGTADAEVWHRRWLEAVTQSMDAYMRSPAFLDMLIHAQRAAQPETPWAWERFLKAPQAADPERAAVAAATAHDVVYEAGSLKLLHYHREHPPTAKEPVLICFALVNRPYILDLLAERSVVRQLLARGLDVYLIDWGVPSAADRRLRLADYVGRSMKEVADVVCRRADCRRLNLLGYCMGGTMSAMFTALFPARVRNLILLAAPIDFSGDRSLLNVWCDEQVFDVDGLIDAFGNCPGEFLQVCFQMMKPVQNYYEKYAGLLEKTDDEEFLDMFFAMQRWTHDSIPVAGETFREFVKSLYRRNMLIRGEMRLDGQPVDLKNITCPLLSLVAEGDHLVPPESTLAIEQYVSSTERQHMQIDAGHIGLAVSSQAHRQLWPEAADWIARHSSPGDGKRP